LALPARESNLVAQALDRVVAAVGRLAITQSDVMAEYRLEAFLESGQLPSALPDPAAFQRVRDHLIDQKVLTEEAAAEGPEPADSSRSAADQLAALRQRFPSVEAFRSALGSLGTDEQHLLDRFENQERILRIIDGRLRPLANVESRQIEAYYRDRFLPEYAQNNKQTPPPLAQVEGQIREILVQQEIDRLLPSWLEKLRSTHRVRVVE